MTDLQKDVLAYAKESKYKFWVLKIETFIQSLTDEEIVAFGQMLDKHGDYRVSIGKTRDNEYWIVNKDDTPIDNIVDFLKAVKAEHRIEENERV